MREKIKILLNKIKEDYYSILIRPLLTTAVTFFLLRVLFPQLASWIESISLMMALKPHFNIKTILENFFTDSGEITEAASLHHEKKVIEITPVEGNKIVIHFPLTNQTIVLNHSTHSQDSKILNSEDKLKTSTQMEMVDKEKQASTPTSTVENNIKSDKDSHALQDPENVSKLLDEAINQPESQNFVTKVGKYIINYFEWQAKHDAEIRQESEAARNAHEKAVEDALRAIGAVPLKEIDEALKNIDKEYYYFHPEKLNDPIEVKLLHLFKTYQERVDQLDPITLPHLSYFVSKLEDPSLTFRDKMVICNILRYSLEKLKLFGVDIEHYVTTFDGTRSGIKRYYSELPMTDEERQAGKYVLNRYHQNFLKSCVKLYEDHEVNDPHLKKLYSYLETDKPLDFTFEHRQLGVVPVTESVKESIKNSKPKYELVPEIDIKKDLDVFLTNSRMINYRQEIIRFKKLHEQGEITLEQYTNIRNLYLKVIELEIKDKPWYVSWMVKYNYVKNLASKIKIHGKSNQ